MKLVYSVEHFLGIWPCFRVWMHTIYDLTVPPKEEGYASAILSIDSRHFCEGQSGPLVDAIAVQYVGRAWPIPNVQICSPGRV